MALEKDFVSNTALLQWLKNGKKSVDNKGTFGALLTDLSKAFDCIPYELLIAKLTAYRFDLKALKFIYSYINNRKKKVRINEKCSRRGELLFGVPQRSILYRLLFIIFLCDLFHFEKYIDAAGYADSNTPQSADYNIENTVLSLESFSARLFNWSQQKAKVNPDKCNLLLSLNQNKLANINDNATHNSYSEKLLEITIDRNLEFDIHVNNLCQKASQKLNPLTLIESLMDLGKRRSVMKTFISSHFNYWPPV